MVDIKRIYVEKKKGCDIEASQLFNDIKENLEMSNLEGLRILYRYDIEGVSEEAFKVAEKTVFSEPPVDYVYLEKAKIDEDEITFGMEYLPGQYDQRADSAMQCIQIISGDDNAIVAAAKIFVLKGKLTIEDVEKIKSYCINPVDSREASTEKPDTLKMNLTIPKNV